jgi:hypothetical protein
VESVAGETEIFGVKILNTILSTTNPIWPSNSGRHGGSPGLSGTWPPSTEVSGNVCVRPLTEKRLYSAPPPRDFRGNVLCHRSASRVATSHPSSGIIDCCLSNITAPREYWINLQVRSVFPGWRSCIPYASGEGSR